MNGLLLLEMGCESVRTHRIGLVNLWRNLFARELPLI